MGIRMTTSIGQVEDALLREADRMHTQVVRTLSYLGELCITEARDRSPEMSWIDHTGNLRSSIGYVVVYDGRVVAGSRFTTGGRGSLGGAHGKALAEELARTTGGKYALIVVAGMHYAVYVEAMSGKVVLASAELLAQRQAPRLIDRLIQSLGKTTV